MTRVRSTHPLQGVVFALLAAALFGASTPLAKLLVGEIHPVVLAGLLYLGSGTGLSVIWLFQRVRNRSPEPPLQRADLPWLLGAVAAGGVLAPVLLLLGLAATPASSASLLLNLEGVATAVIAWLVFKENRDARVVAGMVAIVAGGLVLSTDWNGALTLSWGSLLIAAACVGWALDNNLTRQISLADPGQIALIKGLAAGTVNLTLGLAIGGTLPPLLPTIMAILLGFVSYGISLVLFVLALRHLGTARTGAYFSTAPFVGAALALLVFHEPPTLALAAAGALMSIGVWLHLTETHDHLHHHPEMEHEHMHVHDEHHRHEHGPDDPPGEPHCHPHRHEALTHSHPHYPDPHHQHDHK